LSIEVRSQNTENLKKELKDSSLIDNYGRKFYQNDIKLKDAELRKLLNTNKLAYSKMNSAINQRTAGTLLQISGGVMMLIAFGQAASEATASYATFGLVEPETANWINPVFFSGLGLIIIGIPIKIDALKKKRSAVELYNKSLLTKEPQSQVSLKFGSTNNRVGLFLTF
jgi:uncharacterized protein (DUF39 family)